MQRILQVLATVKGPINPLETQSHFPGQAMQHARGFCFGFFGAVSVEVTPGWVVVMPYAQARNHKPICQKTPMDCCELRCNASLESEKLDFGAGFRV